MYEDFWLGYWQVELAEDCISHWNRRDFSGVNFYEIIFWIHIGDYCPKTFSTGIGFKKLKAMLCATYI